MGSNPISSTRFIGSGADTWVPMLSQAAQLWSSAFLSFTVLPHLFRPHLNSLFDHQASATKKKSSHSRFSRGTIIRVSSDLSGFSRGSIGPGRIQSYLRRLELWLSSFSLVMLIFLATLLATVLSIVRSRAAVHGELLTWAKIAGFFGFDTMPGWVISSSLSFI